MHLLYYRGQNDFGRGHVLRGKKPEWHLQSKLCGSKNNVRRREPPRASRGDRAKNGTADQNGLAKGVIVKAGRQQQDKTQCRKRWGTLRLGEMMVHTAGSKLWVTVLIEWGKSVVFPYLSFSSW